MARGTSLEVLVDMLRAEIRDLTDVSVGTSNIPSLKQTLRRTQRLLYNRYDWPFLKHMPYLSCANGQRFYNAPSGLNLERIIDVSVWYGNVPSPIERGIGLEEYQSYDSDGGIKASPVRKWDWKWNPATSTDQIEMWPIPDNSNDRLQFTGLRALNALTADSDPADIDDDLIVLFSAAEILAAKKQEDAPAKLSLAREHYNTLTGNYTRGKSPTVMGGGRSSTPMRNKTIVVARGL